MKFKLMVSAVIAGGLAFAPALAAQYVYPAKGQSPEQQKKDEYECHTWAVKQTGYDPAKPQAAAAPAAPAGAAPGSGARGAARGAVVGGVVGNVGNVDSSDAARAGGRRCGRAHVSKASNSSRRHSNNNRRPRRRRVPTPTIRRAALASEAAATASSERDAFGLTVPVLHRLHATCDSRSHNASRVSTKTV